MFQNCMSRLDRVYSFFFYSFFFFFLLLIFFVIWHPNFITVLHLHKWRQIPQTSPLLYTYHSVSTIKYKRTGFSVGWPNLKIISLYYQYPRAGTIFIPQRYFKYHYIPVCMCSQPGIYTNIAIHMVFSH